MEKKECVTDCCVEDSISIGIFFFARSEQENFAGDKRSRREFGDREKPKNMKIVNNISQRSRTPDFHYFETRVYALSVGACYYYTQNTFH